MKKKAPRPFVDQLAFRDAFRAGKVPSIRLGLGGVEVKADESGTSFIMSNAESDRMGDSIHVDGWTLDGFVKNPVLLWAHDYQTPPVGRVGRVAIEGKNLIARDVVFQAREVFEFGWSVGQMYLQKFLNAVSVGFDPLELEWKTDESGGIDFLRQDLLELSAVPVPAHAGALQLAKSAGLLVPDWKKWSESVLDDHEKAGKGSPETALIRSARQFHDTIAPPQVQVPADIDEPAPEFIELTAAMRENTEVVRATGDAVRSLVSILSADVASKSLASTADRITAKALSLLKKS